MYTYYLLSIWKPEIKSSKSTKKNITRMQLVINLNFVWLNSYQWIIVIFFFLIWFVIGSIYDIGHSFWSWILNSRRRLRLSKIFITDGSNTKSFYDNFILRLLLACIWKKTSRQTKNTVKLFQNGKINYKKHLYLL